MAEGITAFLGRDLRQALAAGAERTPAFSPVGGRWLVRWALVSLIVGLTLYLACGYHAGFARVNGLGAQIPDRLWQWLTMLGDERVAFALTLFFSRRYPRVFWALIAAALVGVAITHSLKPQFAALRPPAVLEPGSFNLIGPGHRKASFPSGHTTTAAVFFGVWVYFVRASWRRALLVVLAVAAGLSRVAVGVHWPVDVAAGLAGGALAAWLGTLLARRVQWGVQAPAVHLAFVVLAAAFALSLLFSDGGYALAAGMQRVVGVAALGFAAFGYLIEPGRRWLKSRRDGAR